MPVIGKTPEACWVSRGTLVLNTSQITTCLSLTHCLVKVFFGGIRFRICSARCCWVSIVNLEFWVCVQGCVVYIVSHLRLLSVVSIFSFVKCLSFSIYASSFVFFYADISDVRRSRFFLVQPLSVVFFSFAMSVDPSVILSMGTNLLEHIAVFSGALLTAGTNNEDRYSI